MSRRVFVLGVVLLSTFTFPLTIAGASIALPAIRAGLGADLAATQWVVNGYNGCFAGFLVFAGSLADVLGRRRTFACGAVLLSGCGLASAMAGNIVLLDVLRAVAGVGAAAAVTGGAAILADTFPGRARVRAFGLLGTVLGAGLAFGPTIGGALVDGFGWQAVFAAPAGLMVVVLALVPLLPGGGAGAAGRRVDVAGGVLFTAALLLVIFALVQGPELGFGSPVILGAFGVAGGAAAGFVAVERRVADPVFDLALLANRGFAACCVAAGSIVVVLVPLLVYLPSYLITVVGLDAGRAGLWLLLLTAPTVLLPTVGAALARVVPHAVLCAACVAVTGLGAVLLVTLNEHSTPWGFAGPALLASCGFGLSTGLLDGQAVGAVPGDQAGSASGMFNTARLASETVGVAVVGALLATFSGGSLAGPAYTAALHTVCVLLGGFAVVATVLVGVLARTPARGELITSRSGL